MHFTKEQIEHIKAQVETGLQHPKLQAQELVGVSLPCAGCMIGLNIVAGGALAVVIAAGVVFGPETAVCVAIAAWFGEGVTAAAVATVLNGLAGGGVVSSVEVALEALCEAFGAC